MADFFRCLVQKVRVCTVINPMAMMKMMQAKNKFTENHPKFVQFLSAVFSGGIEEDTIIEISVEKPGQNRITSNIKDSEAPSRSTVPIAKVTAERWELEK